MACSRLWHLGFSLLTVTLVACDNTPGSDDSATDTEGEPVGCVGESAADGDGLTGGPDPGDQACGDGEMCVIDECVPIPYASLPACGQALSPSSRDVAIDLRDLVGSDYDGDGADELWGYHATNHTIEVWSLDGELLAERDVGEQLITHLVPTRRDGPDGIAVIAPDGERHVVMHLWPSDEGLELAVTEPAPGREPREWFAHDFDEDGDPELVLGFQESGLELWTLPPGAAPTLVDQLEDGGRRSSLQPRPDGAGLVLAVSNNDEARYFSASGQGLEPLGTYALAEAMPFAFGAFLDGSAPVPVLAGEVSFSEFDAVQTVGLGVFDGMSLEASPPYVVPLPIVLGVFASDLDGDGRDEALVVSHDDGVIVRFDADGQPCHDPTPIDDQVVLGDLDGDGNPEFIQPTPDGVRVYSGSPL